MSFTFDGPNRLIILSPGVTTLGVQDMYSHWKEWVAANYGANMVFPQALRVVGGDATVGDNVVSSYFFLMNGWRVRPQEANHVLTVTGTLIDDAGGDPFADTVGIWRVRIVQVVPLLAETITVYSGGGSTLSKQDVRNALTLPATVPAQQGSIDQVVNDVGDLVVAFS